MCPKKKLDKFPTAAAKSGAANDWKAIAIDYA
jgi:hypothetical protein